MLTKPAKELTKELKTTVCHFLLYISERQAKFDQRTRDIAEHRISNAIFDLEINSTPAFPIATSIANNASLNLGTTKAATPTAAEASPK